MLLLSIYKLMNSSKMISLVFKITEYSEIIKTVIKQWTIQKLYFQNQVFCQNITDVKSVYFVLCISLILDYEISTECNYPKGWILMPISMATVNNVIKKLPGCATPLYRPLLSFWWSLVVRLATITESSLKPNLEL